MLYEYKRQLDEIENYLRQREKTRENFKIGIEFEHFIIDKTTFETVTYWDELGVRHSLNELEKAGWTGDYEGEYILGAHKGNKVISLEPGSQFEFSVKAQESISEIFKEYREFVVDINKILEPKGQALIAVGYHPKTKIEDIKILPKKRYDYMFNYFKSKGACAHNMMKGTASLQVSLDYRDEEDYRKKVKLANSIAPIMYGISDNSYYFQGERFPKKSLRTMIWTNMDDERSGTIPGSLDGDFSYRTYGEYILNTPPIFIMEEGQAIFTGEKKVRELFNPDDYKLEELEHMMTMVFPDVRTKGFIEIRMMDSIPYPYNFAVVSMIKGIFYSEENIDRLYEIFKDIDYEDIEEAKKNIITSGISGEFLGRKIIDWGGDLVELAKEGLCQRDRSFLRPFYDLIESKKNPYSLIDEKSELGLEKSLSHCIITNEVI